jgi:hypothetical protein
MDLDKLINEEVVENIRKNGGWDVLGIEVQADAEPKAETGVVNEEASDEEAEIFECPICEAELVEPFYAEELYEMGNLIAGELKARESINEEDLKDYEAECPLCETSLDEHIPSEELLEIFDYIVETLEAEINGDSEESDEETDDSVEV